MKKLLQTTLAVIFLAGASAYAEDLAESKALILEVAKETMQEMQKNTDGKSHTRRTWQKADGKIARAHGRF